MLNPNEAKTVLETALLAAQEPLTPAELRRLFEDDIGLGKTFRHVAAFIGFACC